MIGKRVSSSFGVFKVNKSFKNSLRVGVSILALGSFNHSYAQGLQGGNSFGNQLGNQLPQAGSGLGAVDGLRQNLKYNMDLLGIQTQALRYHRLTKSLGNLAGVGTQRTEAFAFETQLLVLPIEAASIQAIKFGITNTWASIGVISSAAFYFSDSYAGASIKDGNWNSNSLSGANSVAMFPTQNSIYVTCSYTNGSAVLLCPNGTAGLPTAATMYAITATGNIPPQQTATVTDGTHVTMSGNAIASGQEVIQFANVAPACKEYFDNGGADVDSINTAGTARSFTYQGPAGVSAGTASPTNLQWGDFVPCQTIPRADGGTRPVLFVYISFPTGSSFGVSAATLTGNAASGYNYNGLVAPTFGNRYYIQARPWLHDADYADNPAGTGYTINAVQAPSIAISYITDQKGWNIVSTGDSLMNQPDGMTTAEWRGCAVISTPQAPCEWTGLAWGGTTTTTYLETWRNVIQSIQPSALVFQPFSRNDGLTPINLASVEAKFLAYATQEAPLAKIGFQGYFPLTTTLDGSVPFQTSIKAIYNQIFGFDDYGCPVSTNGYTCPMIPIFDPSPQLSRANYGGNNWDYLSQNAITNGTAAAGSTTVSIVATSGAAPCYAGDRIKDLTNPAVIKSGATVTSSTASAITYPSTTVIGAGISSGDKLVCWMPAYPLLTMTEGFTNDNTHPNELAFGLIQPAITNWIKQLLGIQ